MMGMLRALTLLALMMSVSYQLGVSDATGRWHPVALLLQAALAVALIVNTRRHRATPVSSSRWEGLRVGHWNRVAYIRQTEDDH